MNPLAWNHLLFLIPLVAGILLALAQAFGGVGDGSDHDVDHDAGADHDHDAEHEGSPSAFAHALDWLGIGRVPMSLLVTIALLLFGGAGVATSIALLGLPAWASALVSLAVATAICFTLTPSIARRLARVMPATESYNTSKEDLVGKTGEAILRVTDGTASVADVRDARGDLYRIAVRTERGEVIDKGQRVVTIGRDPDKDVYIVTRWEE